MHRKVPHAITPGDGPIRRFEWTLSICVFHDAVKHDYDHHDDVNRIEIRLKTWYHVIVSQYFALKVTGEWTKFRAPINVRKIAYCSFGSIKHTIFLCTHTENDKLMLSKLHYAISSDIYWCSELCSITWYHIISGIHVRCWSHHWRRFRLWWNFRGSRRRDRRVDNPCCFKRRRTLRKETRGHANDHIFWPRGRSWTIH